jgi:hypothetical protein
MLRQAPGLGKLLSLKIFPGQAAGDSSGLFMPAS